ncbi:hypothetical protein Moror_1883 [Moniliophthora roreri MCA 2997]|uniref:Uncharacterized protein n=1 Tax=Moniliophthora roreri (strain MCA 2997) TaxID=1381753 RepID=V2Y7P7_MONRO|nr:hypothetical protein Moror_1883 [Moniliophthora roreri MCA 2997]
MPPNLTAFLDGKNDANLIPCTEEGAGKYDSDTGNTLAPLHSSASQDVDAYSTDGWFHPMNTMQNAYFVTGVHPSGGPLSNLSGHWASFSFFVICSFLIPLVIFIVVRTFEVIPVPGSGAI